MQLERYLVTAMWKYNKKPAKFAGFLLLQDVIRLVVATHQAHQ